MGILEKIPVISFIVFAVWYCYQPGEIFGCVGDWLHAHTPDWMHKPLFDCVNCMTPWYGSAAYWLIWGNSWREWIPCVIGAMGLNVVLTKLFPKDD